MKWGDIISLAVAPDYYHRGIGKALVIKNMGWLSQQGWEYVQETYQNMAAIRI
ncbi:MAG: GNAT family N-acetyltransferase [Armatimonadota bacterium]